MTGLESATSELMTVKYTLDRTRCPVEVPEQGRLPASYLTRRRGPDMTRRSKDSHGRLPEDMSELTVGGVVVVVMDS